MRAGVALLAVQAMITIGQGDSSRTDVYVLDRDSGGLTFESDWGTPSSTSSDAWSPVISGDGRALVYEVNGQLIVRDRASGASRSIGPGRQPSIDEDGTMVAFTSSATDVVAGVDANGPNEDVYLLDRAHGELRRISIDTSGHQAAAGESYSPSITADGTMVAFVSAAPLDGRSANGPQVFVRDTQSGITRRIAEGWDPSISGDGRYVAYVTEGKQRARSWNVRKFALDIENLLRATIGRPGMTSRGRYPKEAGR